MLTADGFDKAIIGGVVSYQRKETVLYSVSKMLEIMMERDGMTEDEALEYFHTNILNSYNGEGMPSYLNDHEPMEFDDIAYN